MSSAVNIEDELPLLRSAFLVEQMSVDQPGFTIKCGLYSWKIHRRLIYQQSQEKSLFRNRNATAATSADFGQDNPWMVARMLQFLYTRTYDVHYLESCLGLPTLECTLESILSDKKRRDEKGFNEDKARDTNRSELEVHLMVCGLAAKYEMATLTDHALHRAFRCDQGDGVAEEILNKALVLIGIPRITKDNGLRKLFAGYLADNREKIDEVTLRLWLKDGTLAIEVMDYLIQKNRDLEQRAASTEVPPNLKKRRPSSEALGNGWNAQGTTDREVVTTPKLASRTIIEARRSVTRG